MPNTYTLTDLMELFLDWQEHDLIEDRMEYTWDDLKESYTGLTDTDCKYLQDLLECAECESSIAWLGWEPELIVECIQESSHQGLDGWTKREQATIYAYLRDIDNACQTIFEQRKGIK